jgi:hypothetical protein
MQSFYKSSLVWRAQLKFPSNYKLAQEALKASISTATGALKRYAPKACIMLTLISKGYTFLNKNK